MGNHQMGMFLQASVINPMLLNIFIHDLKVIRIKFVDHKDWWSSKLLGGLGNDTELFEITL